jgi:hypothetical protein
MSDAPSVLGAWARESLLVLSVLFLCVATLAACSQPSVLAAGRLPIVRGRDLIYQDRVLTLHGVNFNNEPALSCCGGPNINAIDYGPSDYAQVAAWGGNSIRFGLDYAWYEADRARFFQVLDQHVAWAAANHLWMYLVLYAAPGYGTSQATFWQSQRDQQEVIHFWRDVATHYAASATVLGYDVLNEPSPPSLAAWTTLARSLRSAIAEVDPNHLVILEAATDPNSVPAVSGPDVVFSVHNYPGGDDYPGSTPRNWRMNVPLIVGEFGARPSDPDPTGWVASEIARYAHDGVSWTYFVMHEGPGDYGLYACGRADQLACPWTAMINVVAAGMRGSLRPA